MPAALLSILGPLVPYILGAIGLVLVYFGIKQKGVQQEHARQVKQQEKVTAQVKAQVVKAENKDAVINQRVEQEVQKIEDKPPESPKLDPSKLRVGDDIEFKF